MKLCVCTIVSGNYLAYAVVLRDSVRRHNPEAHFRVLVVERRTPELIRQLDELSLSATFADALGIPDFQRIAYKYDITELNTALKPTFLKHLMQEGYSHVIYLDPDIELYSSLQPVMDSMESADITLVPHSRRPVMDGLRPSDIDFLRTGVFNLGFIALRTSTRARAMLDWWEDRCIGLGTNDPSFGTFVDQKWIDLVPCYFESVAIMRHPGCNVAYWNLHERDITYSGGQYLVGDHRLIFFHFSGVLANDPSQLSKHQSRHQLKAGTPLARLVVEYCRSLHEAGHAKFSTLSYSFGALDDGTAITKVMRRSLVCADPAESRPFDHTSTFQKGLRSAHITSRHGRRNFVASSTLNFDQSRLSVRLVHSVVRLLARMLGAERVYLLLRYAAVLSRESHYPSVLLRKQLDFRHLPRR